VLASTSIATSSGRSRRNGTAEPDWELVREDDIFDLGRDRDDPDFAIEHPDGRRAILEIVGFWTPEYLSQRYRRSGRWRLTIRVGCLRAIGLCE